MNECMCFCVCVQLSCVWLGRALHVNASKHVSHVICMRRHDYVNVLQQRLAGWDAIDG